MPTIRHVTWVIALVGLAAGCAPSRSDIVSKTESFPPTQHVDILHDEPQRPHKTIAILEDRWGGAPEQLNARLTQRGKEIGADAVVITGVRNKTSIEWVPYAPSYYGGAYSYYGQGYFYGPQYRPVTRHERSVDAKAIKYLPAS